MRTTDNGKPPLRPLARVQQHVVDVVATVGHAQVADIAHDSGMPRSSVYAALRALWPAGLVERDGESIFDWYLTSYGQRHATSTKRKDTQL